MGNEMTVAVVADTCCGVKFLDENIFPFAKAI